MNKIIIIVIVTTLAILQASCLTSLQPLITAGNAIKENRVTGTWQYNNNVFHVEEMTKSKLFSEIKKSIVAKGGEFQPITGKDREDSIYYSKVYMISFEKKGADHYYAAGFTHIGNDLLWICSRFCWKTQRIKIPAIHPFPLIMHQPLPSLKWKF